MTHESEAVGEHTDALQQVKELKEPVEQPAGLQTR
jgi:hypothetical protein